MVIHQDQRFGLAFADRAARLAGRRRIGLARQAQHLNRLGGQPCRPDQFHRLARLHLAPGLRGHQPRHRPLGQPVNPAGGGMGGLGAVDQNRDASAAGGQSLDIKAKDFGGKDVGHGMLRQGKATKWLGYAAG